MSKNKKKTIIQIIDIVLILMWMATVFCFSNQNGTKSSGTSRTVTEIIVQPILGKDEKKNETIIKDTEKVIRKLAHYTIYTVGGMLIINFANTTEKARKKQILYSIMFGLTYAITDEIHQYFISNRSARIFDVSIDTLGIITGILIYSVIKKHVKNIKEKAQE